LRFDLAKLGNPVAIYTTGITHSANNKAIAESNKMPPGLEKNSFPTDLWLQPAEGEFVVGMFVGDAKREHAFFANHNAYQEQRVLLKLSRQVQVEIFNRKEGRWQALPVMESTVRLSLAPGGGELLRFANP